MTMTEQQVPQETQSPTGEATDSSAAATDQALEASLGEFTDPNAEIARLTAELQAAQDRALRLQAEMENFRRRLYRQMEDERKYATVPLLRDLLGVMDNLDRAIQAAEQSNSAAGLLEGVKMVAQQFHGSLEQHHCLRIAAQGEPFDPNLHQAIGQMPSGEFPAGVVAEVAQAGYRLHDRVVRPAQVLVSTGAASSATATSASQPQ
jgi:molecular chaperone GrpE